jgi:hypothetical protein
MEVIDQDSSGKSGHLASFLTNIISNNSTIDQQVHQNDNIKQTESDNTVEDIVFKRPLTVPSRRSYSRISNSLHSGSEENDMDISEPFEATSKPTSEGRSQPMSESSGPVTRRMAKQQQQRMKTQSTSSSRETDGRSMQQNSQDNVANKVPDLASVPHEQPYYKNTQERYIEDDFDNGVKNLKKQHGYVPPKNVTSSCLNYEELKREATIYELNQKTLVNERKPQELLDIVK